MSAQAVHPSDLGAARARADFKGGSVILTEFAARQAANRAAAVPQARNADSGSVEWGGISWDEWMRHGGTGVAVNESTARSISAVVACTNLIGGSIASVPLHFYRRTADGRERAKTGVPDRLWWLFNERPHRDWSAAAFWQYLSDSRMLHGDAFARIHRVGKNASGFEPWHPDMVEVDRRSDGSLVYSLWPKDGAGRPIVLEADDVIHVPGPGFDGQRSMSQLRYSLMHPAGIAFAADQQAAQFMADGARPDFAIEVPGKFGDADQREALRNSWLQRHSGPGAKKAPVVLSDGMKLHQLTMSMEDAQLLTTRGFQIEEICRVYGVPPWMVGHTEKSTSWGSGIEQQAIGFVTYTLQRHLVAIEQEVNHKLFRSAGTFAEFLTAGLMRGDTKTRFEAYRIALGRAGEPAWMKPSEVRALENLTPDDTLDQAPPAADPTQAGA